MHKNNPSLLTIGLPFYNNEKTLSKAINSILLQSYGYWELILINDGSEDNSYNIAYELAKCDDRIRLISDGQNRGLISRLNQIIELAKGEYIARMDADDMMMPGKLERQMSILMENNEIDVISTAVYTINENDEPVGIRGTGVLNTWDKKQAIKKALLVHPTVIAKTGWYRKNRYSLDFVRAEDFELWCRTFNQTVFYRINEPLFLYREGNVNVKNYFLTLKSLRKMIGVHGPGVLSKSEILIEIAKTYLKAVVYYLFSIFNMQYLLSSRRNKPLNTRQISEVLHIINLIKSRT